MTTNSNQFALTAVQGQVDLGQVSGNVLSCQVDEAETATLVAGDAVTIVDSAGGVPKVLKVTANTAKPFGFLLRNIKDSGFGAGDRCEIGRVNTVVYMTAGAAIARGADVEYVAADTKVITSAGTNPISGFALDKAAADGDLIRVWIKEPTA